MEHILSLGKEYGMLSGGLLLCALSGGGDSVALVHFLKTRGFPVAAAHFDHGLRETSRRDADLARDLCRGLDVPFYLGRGEGLRDLPGNLEENARNARYAFLRETAEKVGADRILTAHTANDNLETVLLHLTRGCGLRGLTGIRPRRGKLCRPMLRTTRGAVEDYLRENGLTFATDETNLDDGYARNRIRHQVVPVLETLNPRVAEAAARMTGRLAAEDSFLTARAEEEVRRARSRADLEKLPPALRWRALELAEEETPLPPLEEREVEIGGRVTTPLWTLETRRVEKTPDLPPRPDRFWLAEVPGPLILRSRRGGDYLRPPFRTGKTVKKWMNELGVPKVLRAAVPVLTFDGKMLAVAGIGPENDALVRPGAPGILVKWTEVFH